MDRLYLPLPILATIGFIFFGDVFETLKDRLFDFFVSFPLRTHKLTQVAA
jgi:hypothetical protein